MGRRRDGNAIFVRHRKNTKTRVKKKIMRKSRLLCPICYESEMFIKVIQKQRDNEKMPKLYLIGCHHCNVGEILPSHPVWTVTDMYNFVADYWRDPRRAEIIFKYPRMRRKVYNFFKRYVTYGKIKVETMEEDEEE